MKKNLIRLCGVCCAILFFSSLYAQPNAGDYRSKRPKLPVANFDWGQLGNWERFDGSNWVTPTAGEGVPNNSSGIITISAGDSIRLTDLSATSAIDQVIIEAGGSLLIYNTTINLTDVPDQNDLEVYGMLTLSNTTGGNTTELITADEGNVHVASGGVLNLNNRTNDGLGTGPILSANTVNDGWLDIYQNATINGFNITVNNRNTMRIFAPGTRALLLNNRTTILNTGTIALQNPVVIGISNITGTTAPTAGGSIINNGRIYVPAGATLNSVETFINITNTGSVEGFGIINFPTTGVNNGVIDPGEPTAAGTLVVNKNFVSGKEATFRINLLPLDGEGTSDLVRIAGGGTYFLGNSRLQIIDHPDVPLGTYTVMQLTTPDAVFVSSPEIVAPSNILVTQIDQNSYTATKTSATLPLSWGRFDAFVRANNKVDLEWETLQELNTAYFDVQWSTDGENYRSLGTVAAAGNSDEPRLYTFANAEADPAKPNFYRLRQADRDNRQSFSAVRPVRFQKGKPIALIVTPNPAVSSVTLNVQENNIRVLLFDISGRPVRSLNLRQGANQMDISNLAPGVFHLLVYRNQELLQTQKIIKQ